MLGLLGKKIGMTHIFDEKGKLVPVTLIEAEPSLVLDVKTQERNGYCALQLGIGEKKKKTNTSGTARRPVSRRARTPKKEELETKEVEKDKPKPVSYYGKTKYESEKVVRSSADRHVILRTAWMYGLNGHNFLKTMR